MNVEIFNNMTAILEKYGLVVLIISRIKGKAMKFFRYQPVIDVVSEKSWCEIAAERYFWITNMR